MTFLADEIEATQTLLNLLTGIKEAYDDLPEINLADEIVQSEELLNTLQAVRKEADDLPDLS